MDRETLQEVIYSPIKDLKQKFYECSCPECWDELKVELKDLFEKAKGMMDEKFYETYRSGVVKSIEKIYGYKKKQWEKKQFVPPVKVSYIFQDDLAAALTKYIELQTKMMELQYEAKLSLTNEKNYC